MCLGHRMHGHGLLLHCRNLARTLIESWNGTSWSLVPSPSRGKHSYLDSVSCAAGACMATGNHGGKTLIESGPASG